MLSAYDIKAIATLRTSAYQNSLYALGRTAPGKIVRTRKEQLHEYGLAYEIGIFEAGTFLAGSTSTPIAFHLRAAKLGKQPVFFWGGDGISLKDLLHFACLGGHIDVVVLAMLRTSSVDR